MITRDRDFAVKAFRFEDHSIRFFEYKGIPCVLADEAAPLFDYRPDTINTTLQRTEEYKHGRHFFVIEGDDLEALKLLFAYVPDLKSGTSPISPTTRHLTILTKLGLQRLAMRTKKGIGPKLRDWIEDVLERLARDGFVALEGALPGPNEKDTEASRLMMRGLDSIDRKGGISPRAYVLGQLDAIERAIGQVHPIIRRGVMDRLAMLSGEARPGLPSGGDGQTDFEDWSKTRSHDGEEDDVEDGIIVDDTSVLDGPQEEAA